MTVKKTPKMEPLVVNAIRRLQDIQGSTIREINDYISHEYGCPPSAIKKQVQLALKRAVSYGILKNKNGHYIYNADLINDQPMDAEDSTMERGRKMKSRSSRRRKSAKSRKGRSRMSRKPRNKSSRRIGRRSRKIPYKRRTVNEYKNLPKSVNEEQNGSDHSSVNESTEDVNIDGSENEKQLQE